MIIHIHNNLTIAEVQDRFNKCFPFLKIEFYSKPHHYRELTQENYKLDSATHIEELLKHFDQGELELKSWEKAYEVEKAFKDKFGLNVQIHRYANGKWLQTSETDRYTLAELNTMSSPAHPENMPTNDNPNELFEKE